jgi:hypothetical protein
MLEAALLDPAANTNQAAIDSTSSMRTAPSPPSACTISDSPASFACRHLQKRALDHAAALLQLHKTKGIHYDPTQKVASFFQNTCRTLRATRDAPPIQRSAAARTAPRPMETSYLLRTTARGAISRPLTSTIKSSQSRQRGEVPPPSLLP